MFNFVFSIITSISTSASEKYTFKNRYWIRWEEPYLNNELADIVAKEAIEEPQIIFPIEEYDFRNHTKTLKAKKP